MGAEGRGKGVPDWGNGMDKVQAVSELEDWQAGETGHIGWRPGTGVGRSQRLSTDALWRCLLLFPGPFFQL